MVIWIGPVDTEAGYVFTIPVLDLQSAPGLMVEHFYVKSGDPSCILFLYIVRINKQTNIGETLTPRLP